jgi:hypothetical protein
MRGGAGELPRAWGYNGERARPSSHYERAERVEESRSYRQSGPSLETLMIPRLRAARFARNDTVAGPVALGSD